MKTCDTKIMEEYIDVFMNLLPDMLKEHEGQWTVIRDKEPLEFFETNSKAFCAGIKEYGVVPILVREVSKEYSEYGRYGRPMVFHSRVAF